MASARQIYVRLDEQTLEAAGRALEGSGLSVPEAVKLLLTRIARDKALPLDPPLSDRERASTLRGPAPSREANFLFAVNERVVDEATANFLADFMAEFRDHVVRVLTVLPRPTP